MSGIDYYMTVLFKVMANANQYFSEIRYVRRVLSQGIQTVICSAFHGILSWILRLHVDSKNASYLSRFLVLRSSCNRPFGGVRSLRTFTGLAAPPELPTPRTWPGTPPQPTTALSPSVLWEQEGGWSGITFLSPVYVKLFLRKEWLHELGVFVPEERWLRQVWNMFSYYRSPCLCIQLPLQVRYWTRSTFGLTQYRDILVSFNSYS